MRDLFSNLLTAFIRFPLAKAGTRTSVNWPRTNRARGLIAAILLGGNLHAATPTNAVPIQPQPITSVERIRQLTPEEVESGPAVSLEGVVTVCVNSKCAFVQDATDGMLVYYSRTERTPEPGWAVKVTGQVGPGKYAPVIIHGFVSNSVSATPMPVPPLLDYDGMLEDRNHARLIETIAVIRCVPPSRTPGTYMEAVAGGHRFLIIMTDVGGNPIPREFFGATVKLQGVCASLFNTKHQIRGAKIYIQSYADITLIEPASPLPAPVRTIASLAAYTPESVCVHSVCVRGTVTHETWKPGHTLFISDVSGALSVQLQENQPSMSVGSRVEVVGFPEAGALSTCLSDGTVRLLRKGDRPEPRDVTAAEFFNVSQDSRLVRLRGRLISQMRRPDEWTLFVREGNLVVGAHLDAAKLPDKLPALQPDSLLELTGVCHLTAEGYRDALGFGLLLDSVDDVRVVSPPPWWNLRHTLAALGVLALVALSVGGWLVALRRQTRRQTKTIAGQLQREAALEQQCRELYENTSDIIFDQDGDGRLLSLNPAIERITGYSIEEARRVFAGTLGPAREQARNSHSAEIELRAKDGRRVVLDVRSRLICTGDRTDRLLGIARDVTERKIAGEKLCAAKQQIEDANDRLAASNREVNETIVSLRAQIAERKHALERVEAVRRELCESSRLAGKAEMATNVLHNVGNVLNSVNVSVGVMIDKVRKSRATILTKAVALLQEHQTNLGGFLARDEKGRQLPKYLAQLSEHLASEQATLLREADVLTSNLDHIHEIISVQQNYARMSGAEETVELKDVVEDALRIQASSWEREDIRLIRDYHDAPPVRVNRLQALQVVRCLLEQAVLACNENEQSSKRVTVRTSHGGENRVKLEVTHNGADLATADLRNAFTNSTDDQGNGYRFSPRGAMRAVTEMGGALTIHSDGPGSGVVLSLELPTKGAPEDPDRATTPGRNAGEFPMTFTLEGDRTPVCT